MEEAREFLLLIKTTEARLSEVRDVIREYHSYELPEVIAVPVADGPSEYLAWMGAS